MEPRSAHYSVARLLSSDSAPQLINCQPSILQLQILFKINPNSYSIEIMSIRERKINHLDNNENEADVQELNQMGTK